MNVKLAGKKYFTLFYTPHIFNGIEYMYFSFGIAVLIPFVTLERSDFSDSPIIED